MTIRGCRCQSRNRTSETPSPAADNLVIRSEVTSGRSKNIFIYLMTRRYRMLLLQLLQDYFHNILVSLTKRMRLKVIHQFKGLLSMNDRIDGTLFGLMLTKYPHMKFVFLSSDLLFNVIFLTLLPLDLARQGKFHNYI